MEGAAQQCAAFFLIPKYPGAAIKCILLIMAQEEKNQSVFAMLAEIFREAGIKAMLIGGYAVNAYHHARYTNDIDFMIVAGDFPKVGKLLQKSGYQEIMRTDLFIRLKSSYGDETILDFLLIDPATMEKMQKDGKETTIAGETFSLPSIFHLIAMKLHAIKNSKHARQLVDFPDIIAILEKNGINVYDASFKQMCLKFGTAELYDEIVKHFNR